MFGNSSKAALVLTVHCLKDFAYNNSTCAPGQSDTIPAF